MWNILDFSDPIKAPWQQSSLINQGEDINCIKKISCFVHFDMTSIS